VLLTGIKILGSSPKGLAGLEGFEGSRIQGFQESRAQVKCQILLSGKVKQMSSESGKGYSQKQAPGTKLNPELAEEIKKRLRGGLLPCAVAFKIAKDMKIPPISVGQAADLLEVPLAKCQLGLFGYTPDKKIARAETTTSQELLAAIRESMHNDRLACEAAWQIADRFKMTRLKVSNVCEGHEIKIKPCQLGAF